MKIGLKLNFQVLTHVKFDYENQNQKLQAKKEGTKWVFIWKSKSDSQGLGGALELGLGLQVLGFKAAPQLGETMKGE